MLAYTEQSCYWNELQNILTHYNKQYNFNFKLMRGLSDSIYPKQGLITINLSTDNQRHYKDMKLRHEYNDYIILFKCVLLHEIKHAIDYTVNHEYWEQENEIIDRFKYHTNKEYHDSLNREKRADNFANEEIKKWR